MKKRVFEAFRIFTKWKARFRNIFRAYKMKTRFWRDFYVYKMKIMFLKSFSSEQNERHVFEAFCIFPKHFVSLQSAKTCFRSVFQMYEMKKNTFSKPFSCLLMKQYVFEAFFIFTKWKIRFGSVFIFTKLKNTF